MIISGDEQQGTKPAPKKRAHSGRLANTPIQMLIVALIAATITLILPITILIDNNWDLCSSVEYNYSRIPLAVKIYTIGTLLPIAFIAAVLGALLARWVHIIIAIVIGVICLPVLAALNLFVLFLVWFFPTGC